ncbi:DnaA-like protein [Pseudaminobacter salicylatoxidans]|uniref:DnaA-like protein n=1 Tax=Pseudaminobacter salicylatoxidans TaxID=93369 RepID=A0A316BZU3_PSESE|nr:helix-turn-helix domain-containing protein [Pseudaminobacter salicylatoxidans]PWJ80620.1 DnaA-like protein [Pseudaminobacter salicylatoxidans]
MIASYRRTEEGIRRIAAERRRSMAAPLELIKPSPEPISEPAKVIPLRTPRDDLMRIIDLVARMHGARGDEIFSAAKSNRVAYARQAAICAVKVARPDMTLMHVGRVFGRDHTTILSAMRKRGFRSE